MEYLVVYSSRTGNTEKLAMEIFGALPGKSKDVQKVEEYRGEADTYFVGFWNHKGICSEDILNFLEGLHGKRVALFGTCGMGKDRYSFEQGHVKTATEVVSEKSDLFQSLRKHELLLEHALVGLAEGVASLLGVTAAFETRVNFDDSIIEDAGSTRQRDLQEVRDGIMQAWEFRAKWYGETEEQAKAMGGKEPEADAFGLA